MWLLVALIVSAFACMMLMYWQNKVTERFKIKMSTEYEMLKRRAEVELIKAETEKLRAETQAESQRKPRF